MDKRSVCLFLGMKRLSATAMHKELVDVLGSDAIADATVTKYLRSASFEVKGTGWDERPGEPGTNRGTFSLLFGHSE
jgi:hypothetical protein